ncbi:YibE/F family protein [Megasphaera paucivorans]|uniref:Uncharacterized membrane protein n=1 Tax=Megasphaera paucivorans TaxID=349095 RepID=A0A1G9ZJ69_9FIRM|nr:YibE/F family protein [Megasphaera paucivorans]SDN21350.1 Uncharacterized membrane protein [Megasphaera paucivorans]
MKLKSLLYKNIFLLFLLFGMCMGNIAFAANPPAVSSTAQTVPAYVRPQYFYATVEKIQKPPHSPSLFEKESNDAQLVTLKLTSGPNKGSTITSLHKKINMNEVVNMTLLPGDRVIVAKTDNAGKIRYDVADYQRLPYVYILLGIFVLTLLVIGRKVGIKSLFVVCFAIAVILKIMIPEILRGQWPIPYLTFAISALITVVTQITVSGWKAKTWGAILGTVGGVAMASLLASASIFWMHLTGLDTEEAIMLRAQYLHSLNFQDIVFASIILGALGAVMDVAISISSSLQEIQLSNPAISRWNLFSSGLNIGKDIMGTMTNTLILAYLGSFLPLILLFAVQQNMDLIPMLNLGMIVTEIVRALTGSIGLIFTIPITAAITSFFLTVHRPKTNRVPEKIN